MPDPPPIVLVLSGLDPTGGAGLAADLRALATLDVHARALVTANTVQGAQRTVSILPTAEDLIGEQIAIAVDDRPDAAKTGLVPNAKLARAIARSLPEGAPLVVDPVLRTGHGQSLVPNDEDAYASLIARAHLATPNAAEARAITGLTRLEDAAWALQKMGAENVLITGGDEPGPIVTDLLLTSEGELIHHHAPRIEGGRTRGAGCTLASLIAGHVAQGYATADAVFAAIDETHERIRGATTLGRTDRVLPAAPRSLLSDARAHDREARERIADVAAAWRRLRATLTRSLVPEVGSNLAYLPPEGDPARAAVLSARCVRTGTGIVLAGPVEIGGAHHTARIASVAHGLDERVRCAMNLRHRPELASAAEAGGFVVASFRRIDQPTAEPSTVAWGTRAAFQAARQTPDLITDEGGLGKEPMLRILGVSPADVADKIERILAAPEMVVLRS